MRRVYARSWPLSARGGYDDTEIIARLGDRCAAWWARAVRDVSVAVVGGPVAGGWGFALGTVDGGTTATLSHLFVEPEAHGYGLAGQLHDAAVAGLERLGAVELSAWVLAGNTRSQAFFAGRGWVDEGPGTPPFRSPATFHRFTLVR